MLRRLLCFLFACLPLALPAQQPYMWRLTDAEGLPSMTVYHLLQDSRGFMWFGTEAGICRFDGRAFHVFPASSAKSRSATSLVEDKKGNIWFRNFAKQIFRIEQEKIVEFVTSADATDARGYAFNHRDTLVTVDWGGLFVTDMRYKRWHQVYAMSQHTLFWDLHAAQDGTFWLFSEQGIALYKAGKYRYIDLEERPKRFCTKDNLIYTFEDQKRRMLVWEGEQKRVLPFSFAELGNVPIYKLYVDKAHNFWFCTAAGIWAYDKAGKPLFGGKPLLPDIAVSSILQDREGTYWIATLKEGLFVMPQLDALVYNATNHAIPSDVVNCLAVQDDGYPTLLLGFNNGMVGKFSADKGVFFTYDTEQKQQVETIFYHQRLKKLYVSAGILLLMDTNGKILERKKNGAVKKMGLLNDYDAVFAAGAESTIARVYPTIAQDSLHDKSWTRRWKPVYTVFEGTRYLFSPVLPKRMRSVWVDRGRQEFWIASIDGLFLCDKKGMREIFDQKGKSIFGISFSQASDGKLWVGTIEQGLYAIENHRVVLHLSTKNGLVGNFCRTVWAQDNAVWFSTGKGIQVYDVAKRSLSLFNRHDGLHTYDVADIRILRDTLWVATPKGLLSIHKDSLKTNQTPPLIYIQAFRVAESSQKLNDNYTLQHHENNIKIDFQGLAYRSRGEFKYKYRMLGLDSTWIYTDNTNNFARFPSLPVGEYEFQVKAVNEDGIESEGMAIIQIIILPPWWRTWWATVLFISILAGLVWAFVRWRLSRMEARSRIEQELRSSQLATLKVQMNPHFIFNALNSIQEFIWLNEKRLANQYLGKFADLMRLTLDMSNETYIPLSDELKVLNLYLELEGVRFENLAYKVHTDENLDAESVYIPSMLIQPYIENAIKHGLLHKTRDRQLSIEMRLNAEQDMLLCEIEDNGVGRAKSKEIQLARPKRHKSFATSATQKRLELLNYGRKKAILVQFEDLQDADGTPTGTRVSLQIPIRGVLA